MSFRREVTPRDILVKIDDVVYKPTAQSVTIEPGYWPIYTIDIEANPFYESPYRFTRNQTNIKNVIFNPPATIVFWTDGTKTVVKTQDGEPFDPEKGLAMAIAKKSLGNKGNYFNQIKKWTEKFEEPKLTFTVDIDSRDVVDKTRIAVEALKDMAKRVRDVKIYRGV